MEYPRMTYDTSVPLTVAEIARLEKDFPDNEYLICDEKNANIAARGEILSSLWAFSSEWLAEITELPSEAFSCMQTTMHENANESITALVKSTCGLDVLVNAAIDSDGRGHFLSHYDSEEIEYKSRKGTTLYLYRQN